MRLRCPEIARKTDSGEGSRLVRFHVPEYEDNILVEEVAALRADDQVLVPSVHHVDRLGPVVSNHREDLEAVWNRRAVGCLRGTLVLEWERGTAWAKASEAKIAAARAATASRIMRLGFPISVVNV